MIPEKKLKIWNVYSLQADKDFRWWKPHLWFQPRWAKTTFYYFFAHIQFVYFWRKKSLTLKFQTISFKSLRWSTFTYLLVGIYILGYCMHFGYLDWCSPTCSSNSAVLSIDTLKLFNCFKILKQNGIFNMELMNV